MIVDVVFCDDLAVCILKRNQASISALVVFAEQVDDACLGLADIDAERETVGGLLGLGGATEASPPEPGVAKAVSLAFLCLRFVGQIVT